MLMSELTKDSKEGKKKILNRAELLMRENIRDVAQSFVEIIVEAYRLKKDSEHIYCLI